MSILAITLPIFLLIALGWFAVRRGMFSKDETRAMGRFVLNFALPAVLFRALADRPLAEVVSARYLAAYALGSVLMLGAGLLVFRARGHRPGGAAILGLGLASSNTAFIGLPVVTQFLGHAATAAVAQTMLIENLLVVPLALGLAESGEGAGARLRDILRTSLLNLVRTPMIVAIILGALASLVGLKLPALISRPIELMAGASTPVALFVIGGALVGLNVRGLAADVAAITVGKLLLHPLAVAAFALLFGLVDPVLRSAAIVLAAAPMLSIFPILGQRRGVEEVSAAALVVATVASFATLSVLLWVLR